MAIGEHFFQPLSSQYRVGADSSLVMGKGRDEMGMEITSHVLCIYKDLCLQSAKT